MKLDPWVGHWEFDTVVGPFHGSCLLTGVERKLGFAVAALLTDGSAESAFQAMIELLKPLAGRINTVTTDKSKEFARRFLPLLSERVRSLVRV